MEGTAATFDEFVLDHEPSMGRQEKIVRDLQAADFFRKVSLRRIMYISIFYELIKPKGLDAANSSTSELDQSTAIEHLSIAISLRSNQSRYFSTRAGCFRNLNEFQYAIEDLTMASMLEPQNPTFYATRANCYRKTGNIANALEDLTMAIEKDTRKQNHYLQRGLTLYEAKFYKESIQDFSKVIDELEPGSKIEFRAYFKRAGAYHKIGQYQEAREDLLKAIAADVKNPSGYNLLGQVFIDLEQYEEAIRYTTEAIGLQGEAKYYNSRGMAYLAMVRPERR